MYNADKRRFQERSNNDNVRKGEVTNRNNNKKMSNNRERREKSSCEKASVVLCP